MNNQYIRYFLYLSIVFSNLFSSPLYNDSWAVIVGINGYTGDGIAELNYAVKDAEDIRQVLIDNHNIDPEKITLLLDEDATKSKIEEALLECFQIAGENDRIIFYFAGHGQTVATAVGGEMGYLLPVDVKDMNKIVIKGLDMKSLKDLTAYSKAKHILFLVDACYSGLAAVGARGLDPVKEGDAYWRKITRGKVRKIITAGRRDEPVIEKSEWGHSVFAKNILRGIGDERAADLNNDNFITSDELGLYLKDKVGADTNGDQSPQSDRLTSDDGEFVFSLPVLPTDENEKIEITPIQNNTKPQEGISAKDLDTYTKSLFSMFNSTGNKERIPEFKRLNTDTARYSKLLRHDFGYIDTSHIKERWLQLPKNKIEYDRISGFQVGLQKNILFPSPVAYQMHTWFLYSHAREDFDYSMRLKRFILNQTNNSITVKYYKKIKTYDHWTVTDPDRHTKWMAGIFNVDHLDYFISEGHSFNHHYYNQYGFSSDVTIVNEKQLPIEKHSDFSLLGFKKDFRNNYFDSETYFDSGRNTSISIDLGIGGAIDSYSLTDNRFEIQYELDDLDIPLEYITEYNRINVSSDHLENFGTASTDSSEIFDFYDVSTKMKLDFEEGASSQVQGGGGITISQTMERGKKETEVQEWIDDYKADTLKGITSEDIKNRLRELYPHSILEFDKSNAYINHQEIDTTLHSEQAHDNGIINATQYVNYSISNPLGDTTGVRFFGTGPDSNNPYHIYLDDANVQADETYFFSFYVRTVKDTMDIAPAISENDNDGIENKLWEGIGPEWKRVWVKKRFSNLGENPRTFITTTEGLPMYVWGVQLEKAEFEQEEPREYKFTDGSWEPLMVRLIPESPNWGWSSIILDNNGDGIYSTNPLLTRGSYTYRLQIGDNIFLDPNEERTSQNENGEEVSMFIIGGPPKLNIAAEYSSPDIGSDFNYSRLTYNLRHSFPISHYETIYLRLVGGVMEGDSQPLQKNFFLGNVGTLRGYNVKEFTGNKMILLNFEYHVNLIDKIFSSFFSSLTNKAEQINLKVNEEEIKSNDLSSPEYNPKTWAMFDGAMELKSSYALNFKPFLFYDMGLIGDEFDSDNIYQSVGIGINMMGIQLILASRLDRSSDNLSVLFDFGGFMHRDYFLPN